MCGEPLSKPTELAELRQTVQAFEVLLGSVTSFANHSEPSFVTIRRRAARDLLESNNRLDSQIASFLDRHTPATDDRWHLKPIVCTIATRRELEVIDLLQRLEAGDVDSVEAELRLWISSHPTSYEAVHLLAQCRRCRGDAIGHIRELRRGIEILQAIPNNRITAVQKNYCRLLHLELELTLEVQGAGAQADAFRQQAPQVEHEAAHSSLLACVDLGEPQSQHAANNPLGVQSRPCGESDTPDNSSNASRDSVEEEEYAESLESARLGTSSMLDALQFLSAIAELRGEHDIWSDLRTRSVFLNLIRASAQVRYAICNIHDISVQTEHSLALLIGSLGLFALSARGEDLEYVRLQFERLSARCPADVSLELVRAVLKAKTASSYDALTESPQGECFDAPGRPEWRHMLGVLRIIRRLQ